MRGAGPWPPTLAGGHGAAPLAAAPALGAGRAPQHVAAAAGEVHHVVEVELGATREPMGGVPGVAARDGCGGRGGQATSPPGRTGPPLPGGAADLTSQGFPPSGCLGRGRRALGSDRGPSPRLPP